MVPVPRLTQSLQAICCMLTVVLVSACSSSAQSVDTVSTERGGEVFAAHCANCHGAVGQGIEPWYPSLQRIAALRSADELIETLITGRFQRAGEINGHTIPIMPAWGQLSDADVAAVANYIQQTWGDGSVMVYAQDVAATRMALARSTLP